MHIYVVGFNKTWAWNQNLFWISIQFLDPNLLLWFLFRTGFRNSRVVYSSSRTWLGKVLGSYRWNSWTHSPAGSWPCFRGDWNLMRTAFLVRNLIRWMYAISDPSNMNLTSSPESALNYQACLNPIWIQTLFLHPFITPKNSKDDFLEFCVVCYDLCGTMCG